MVGGSGFMHTEIFSNIDLLVSMAGSSLNVGDIEAELVTVNKEIQNKKQEIEDLKSMMNDARYFNASSELVDKNIEVSLKSKISRLNREIKDIESKLEEIKVDENKFYEDITALKEKINENEKYVSVLEAKIDTSSSNYDSFLKGEEAHLQKLKDELLNKEKKHQAILKNLDLEGQALSELRLKKEAEEIRLGDIVDNLNNPNAYIDQELKSQDEEKLISLHETLDELQKKKLDFLTDPNMIGANAKELVLNENYTEALNKIRELLNVVKEKPFMDVTNLAVLDEELEKKELERNELANYIDSKNYASMNSDEISKRIEYLNNEIEKGQNSITHLREMNQGIDQELDHNLTNLIHDLETRILQLGTEILEYDKLLKDSTKSRRTKANLENGILKKQKEKDTLEQILRDYKSDLFFQVTVLNTVNKIIQKFEGNIEKYHSEIGNLQRIQGLDEVSKDFIEEEKDKEKLKSINEEILQIKTRKKFDRTPDEIYDQIEMLLANESSQTSKFETEKEQTIDLGIDDLFHDEVIEQPRYKVVEMIPAQTIQSDGVVAGGVSYGA